MVFKIKIDTKFEFYGGAIMLVGTVGVGNIIIEIVIGVLLIAAGIWGLKKLKK